MQLPADFREFLRLLNDHRVEYLVVGGYAVNYHGHHRNTGDIDLWVAISQTNAEALVAVLREFGFDLPQVTPELFLAERSIVRMGVEPVRIEVTTSIDGVTFEQCFAERIIADFDGVVANLISLERLKQNKAAAGRMKDLADLDHLP